MCNLLKVCRIIHGYRQSDVTKATGIPQTRVSLLERGFPANADEIAKLSKLFCVPKDSIERPRIRPSQIRIVVTNEDK